MTKLEIVWRNPARVGHQRRWLPPLETKPRRIYVMQELVSPDDDIWASISALEVTCSGTPAEEPARAWLSRFKF